MTFASLPAVPARLRGLDRGRVDLLVAAVVGVELQLEVAVLGADLGRRPIVHVLVGLLAASLAIRRCAPLAALAVGMVPFVALQADGWMSVLYAPLLVTLVLVYSAAAHLDGRALVAAVAIAFAGAALGTRADESLEDGVGWLWSATLVTAAPTAVGRLVRSRTALNRALRRRAADLERERAERLAQATLVERTRIAGELHDVVAHALGAMVVQAGAARRAVAHDPLAAPGAFAAVEATGRDALGELRRVLGVLRRDDEELALAPQPSLAHLRALARRTTAAGLPVEVRVEGEPPALAPGIDLTAYRVVQEALGGALEAGGAGRAEVVVRHGPHAVEVEVTDDGPGEGAAAPRRLLGMRERVGLVGGELQVERPRSGGHVVRARLPLQGAQ